MSAAVEPPAAIAAIKASVFSMSKAAIFLAAAPADLAPSFAILAVVSATYFALAADRCAAASACFFCADALAASAVFLLLATFIRFVLALGCADTHSRVRGTVTVLFSLMEPFAFSRPLLTGSRGPAFSRLIPLLALFWAVRIVCLTS